MKRLRFLQGAYRRALIVVAGGSLYLLSDCDDEVRTSVIAQTGGVVTTIIDAILNAAVNAVTNPPTT